MNQIVIPPLYAIANLDGLSQPTLYVERLLAAGARLVQLRAKQVLPSEFAEIATACLKLRALFAHHADAVSSAPLLIINDDIELCRSVSADGVHLGQTDAPVQLARETLGPNAVIGLSTHNLTQLDDAPQHLLTYVALGQIFASSTKSGHANLVGLDILQRAAKATSLPLVAIGGLTAANAETIFLAGASSVAVIADLQTCADLPGQVALYRRSYERAAAQRLLHSAPT